MGITESRLLRKRFNAEVKEVKNVCLMYEVDQETLPMKQIIEEIGIEETEHFLQELDRFKERLHKEISSVTLPDKFSEADVKKELSKLSVIMSNAKKTFNWDNPILNYIPDTV